MRLFSKECDYEMVLSRVICKWISSLWIFLFSNWYLAYSPNVLIYITQSSFDHIHITFLFHSLLPSKPSRLEFMLSFETIFTSVLHVGDLIFSSLLYFSVNFVRSNWRCKSEWNHNSARANQAWTEREWLLISLFAHLHCIRMIFTIE